MRRLVGTTIRGLRTPIIKVWDGAYHETHNEPNKELAINAFLDWIDEQRGQI